MLKTNFRGEIRKGGEGGTPQICNSFFAGKKIRKGGGTPLTDKIRKVVFDPLPKWITHLLKLDLLADSSMCINNWIRCLSGMVVWIRLKNIADNQ